MEEGKISDATITSKRSREEIESTSSSSPSLIIDTSEDTTDVEAKDMAKKRGKKKKKSSKSIEIFAFYHYCDCFPNTNLTKQ